MAWPADYSKWQDVTIDHTKVPADQTDFVVYLNMADFDKATDLFDTCRTDGGDIRISKSDGTTELAREVVAFNKAGKTGEIHFKFSGTLSSSTDTVVRVWYNGTDTEPAVGATYGRNAVWTGYAAVYHMQDAASGSQTDSTGNGRTLTNKGGVVDGDSAAGKLSGNGVHLAGSTDDGYYYNYINTILGEDPTQFTLTCWAKSPESPASISDGAIVSARDQVGGSVQWPFMLINDYTNNQYEMSCRGTSGFTDFPSSSAYTADAWYYLAFPWQKNASTTFYQNASSVATGTPANEDHLAGNQRLMVGWFYYDASPNERFLEVYVDEIRIVAGSKLASTWLTTEYNNQNSPSTFYSVSSEQTSATTLSTSDSVTITESVSQTQVFTTSVSDAIAITESVTNSVSKFSSVFDAISITESTTNSVSKFSSVFDAVSINESTTDEVIRFLSTSDAASITESVSPLFSLGTLEASVFDLISLTEAVATFGDVLVTSDSITISENVVFDDTHYSSVNLPRSRPRGILAKN